MVHEWEYNSICRDVKTKQATIDRQHRMIARLEQIIRQWAMRLNANDPEAAALILDDLVDARNMKD